MKYTKQKPTKPGWYWVRHPGNPPEIHRFFMSVGSGLVTIINESVYHPIDFKDGLDWAGPIPEPEVENG